MAPRRLVWLIASVLAVAALPVSQGAAKPLHIWPGDSAQELAGDFDALLDRVMRTGRIPAPEAPTGA